MVHCSVCIPFVLDFHQCQVKDWKVHKQLCGKKNTTNLGSDCLLFITKQLVKNHTDTVEIRTERPLTEFQKNDAKAALVKKLKDMFTGEFKQFNSNSSSSDAASDPAFCAALAEFFAKQPGYEEVWGRLCIGYKGELEKQRQMRRKTKSLSVPDERIREYCADTARSLTMQIGFLLSDGNTSDMMDLERHNRLVDELVLVVKRFVRGHLQYDSHRGLIDLGSNEEFKVQMADVVGTVWDIPNPNAN